MIVISKFDCVIKCIYCDLYCGVICINDVEGIYNYEKKVVLIIILICEEFSDFKYLMLKVDLKVFVFVVENVYIIG